LAFENNIIIKIESSPDKEICIWADPEKIHRLYLNLLSNALRYANKKIVIKINGPELTIKDDGPGFSSADLSQVFKPFYRGKEGGSGLGLAITRAIVEQQGGSISASNSSQGGALVKILFSTAKNEGISKREKKNIMLNKII
jgi:signal transduction histidine kinase